MKKVVFGHGGRRPGAGRPPKGPIASEPHKKREEVRPEWPVHAVMRVAPDVPDLREEAPFRAIAKAAVGIADRVDFRIVHASVLPGHIHLIALAPHRFALAKAMHGFQVSAAHWINAATKHEGGVFPDRYRVYVLKTKSDVAEALKVLREGLMLGE